MKIFRAAEIASEGGDPKTFTGDVIRTTLAGDSAGTPVNVYRVEFEAGARTHWHTHTGPQWLLIVDGRIRVQKLGEPPTEVVSGDTVVIQRAKSTGMGRRRVNAAHIWPST